MADDYSRLMAQMIAAARPPRAPAPSRPAILPGGAAGGFGTRTAKETQVSAKVELEPFMRLFGWKSPREKQEIADRMQGQRNSISDEDWEIYRNQEPTQKILESMHKTGYQGVVLGADGKYDMLRTSPEARTRGLTPEQILAGGAGPGPAQQLVTRKGELARAQETPSETAARMAQAEASKATAEAERERLKYLPEEQARAAEELKSQNALRAAQANYYDKMGEAALRKQVEKGTTDKVQLEKIKNVNTIWRKTRDTIDRALADPLIAKAPGRADNLINILTLAVRGHLEGLRAANPQDVSSGNESFGYWMATITDQLIKDIAAKKFGTERTWLHGEVPVDPDADIRWSRRAVNLINFMKELGPDISPTSEEQAMNTFIYIYNLVTPTPRMNQLASYIKAYGKIRGYDMSSLILRGMPKKKKKEVPTEEFTVQ